MPCLFHEIKLTCLIPDNNSTDNDLQSLLNKTRIITLFLVLLPALTSGHMLHGGKSVTSDQQPFAVQDGEQSISEKALLSIAKGIEYFHKFNINGGYVYHYLPDLSRKWGENEYTDSTIEVQPPGTPAVGISYVRAFEATDNPKYLEYAEETATALLYGQNDLGGWDHTITFGKELSQDVSFDDNQSQTAVRFLMLVDQHSDKQEIKDGVIKALQMMLVSQQEQGGWPHYYPEQGNYHDYATFNDGGINDCIKVMIEAYEFYGSKSYLKSIRKVGRYIYISQLPPPQSGWAQQYNEFLQPAWARTFEPPSVCPLVTIRNIHSLIDIFLVTGDDGLLEPIPDAIRWMKETRLPNGKWGRFIEFGTNQPMFYDRGRIRVNSLEELSMERRLTYGYLQELNPEFEDAVERYEAVLKLGRKEYKKKYKEYFSSDEYFENLEKDVEKIIAAQDEQGGWLVKNDRFKNKIPNQMWKGDFLVADRVSSARFNYSISKLSEFIKLSKARNK